MDLSTVLLALSALAALFYYFITRNSDYWTKRGVVGPKPALFFGSLKESTLRRVTLMELIQKYYNDYPKEKIVGLFRFWNPSVLVRDLDILQHIFIKDFDNFVDRGFSLTETGIGGNLFMVEGDKWRVLRTRISPIFTSGKLKNMFHLIEERGDKFMEWMETVVKKTPELNVKPLVQKFTMSTISACAFGIDLDMNANNEDLTKIDDMVTYNYFTQDIEFALPGTLKKFNRNLLPPFVTNYFNSLVQTLIKDRNGKPSSRRDFMDLLLELRNTGDVHGSKLHENDKERVLRITDDLMAAQAFVIFAGGYETSATTLGFMLLELAYHPDIQERLVQEINQVLEENGGKLTYECIKQMTYLDQVISETLRKYPIVDPLTRRSENTYKIPYTDVTIDKGTMVLISARGVHYDEQYWPDPLQFDPDRFTPENIKARHPCAYMPFGLGPRNCIGMRFAHVQSRVCAVRLITKYRVEPTPATTKTFQYNVHRSILAPSESIVLKLIPRS